MHIPPHPTSIFTSLAFQNWTFKKCCNTSIMLSANYPIIVSTKLNITCKAVLQYNDSYHQWQIILHGFNHTSSLHNSCLSHLLLALNLFSFCYWEAFLANNPTLVFILPFIQLLLHLDQEKWEGRGESGKKQGREERKERLKKELKI